MCMDTFWKQNLLSSDLNSLKHSESSFLKASQVKSVLSSSSDQLDRVLMVNGSPLTERVISSSAVANENTSASDSPYNFSPCPPASDPTHTILQTKRLFYNVTSLSAPFMSAFEFDWTVALQDPSAIEGSLVSLLYAVAIKFLKSQADEVDLYGQYDWSQTPLAQSVFPLPFSLDLFHAHHSNLPDFLPLMENAAPSSREFMFLEESTNEYRAKFAKRFLFFTSASNFEAVMKLSRTAINRAMGSADECLLAREFQIISSSFCFNWVRLKIFIQGLRHNGLPGFTVKVFLYFYLNQRIVRVECSDCLVAVKKNQAQMIADGILAAILSWRNTYPSEVIERMCAGRDRFSEILFLLVESFRYICAFHYPPSPPPLLSIIILTAIVNLRIGGCDRNPFVK